MKWMRAAGGALLALAAWAAQAQAVNPTPAAVARLSPDLVFPKEPSTIGALTAPAMALYKPEGNGPFPALVLQHQCGGLSGSRPNLSMLDWARRALARGYVVLMVDSLAPRNVDSVCGGPKGGVTFSRGTRDVLQAAEHLAALPYVDKDRIALAGFSWGAMNALLASSQGWGEALATGPRFRAAVAVYPGCFTARPANGQAPYEVARPDLDRPLLVLMGEEDTETPPAECIPRLEANKARGAPVQWHVYPKATHCWDCQHLNNFRKTDARGTQVLYRYDEAATRDTEKRLFEFLAQALAAPAR